MGPFQRGKRIAGYVLPLHSPVEEYFEGGERVVPTTWTCGEALDALQYRKILGWPDPVPDQWTRRDGQQCLLSSKLRFDCRAVVDRTIRPIALQRKNVLFAGHDAGAQNWAMLAYLCSSRRRSKILFAVWRCFLISDLSVRSISSMTPI